MKSVLVAILAIISIASSAVIRAQDRVFARTYQSNVLPRGVKELEYSSTFRGGRSYYYGALDQRLEMELGLGGNVQTAFYLNAKLEGFADPLKVSDGITREVTLGFSNEWKWKLADPVVDNFGFALYGELGVEPNAFEFEGKLIFDKKIGGNLMALNLVGEYETTFEDAIKGEVQRKWVAPVELDLGYMNMVTENFGVGLELFDRNQISETGWEHSVLFAGPTLHADGNGWFINLNVMPQLLNLHKTATAPGNLVLDEHERVEIRLLTSFSF